MTCFKAFSSKAPASSNFFGSISAIGILKKDLCGSLEVPNSCAAPTVALDVVPFFSVVVRESFWPNIPIFAVTDFDFIALRSSSNGLELYVVSSSLITKFLLVLRDHLLLYDQGQ